MSLLMLLPLKCVVSKMPRMCTCERVTWQTFAMHSARSEERRVGKECRSRCDWSSDVCSSDLDVVAHAVAVEVRGVEDAADVHLRARHLADVRDALREIGRASCRERV